MKNKNASDINSKMKEIAIHKATNVSNIFNRVKISFYIFEANYNELMRWLKVLDNDDFLNKLNTYSDSATANAYLDEVGRLLHNYLSSAFSLVDHTRNMINELYGNENFLQEYQHKLDATISNNNLRRFIQDLRDYLTHYYVPNLTLSFQVQNPDQFKCDVTFIVAELKVWNRWTALSKEYLKDKKTVLLKSVVEEYFRIISDFYTWLQSRQQEIHRPELEDVLKLVEEYNAMIKDIDHKTV